MDWRTQGFYASDYRFDLITGVTLNFIGELAAVATSVAWSGTSVLFTRATQQVGSIIVNRIRVVLGLVFLISLNWVFYGYLLPGEWLVFKEKFDWGGGAWHAGGDRRRGIVIFSINESVRQINLKKSVNQ